MRCRLGLTDHGASWSAVAFDLPGCVVSAASRKELLALAPVAVADHLAWLRRGRLGPDVFEVTTDVVEEVCAAACDAADGEFCFDDDLRAVSDDDVELGGRLMEYSRADLLAAMRGVPDAVLDWRPPITAMAQVDEWNPQPRTIREIAAEVASAEAYYRGALHHGAEATSAGEAPDLASQRSRLIDTMISLRASDRGRRFEPVRPWRSKPEHWTARKVIRRVVSHERFHTAEIRQQLSWLLVGMPRFRGE